MSLLDQIHSPEDLKQLSKEELPVLAKEIRRLLVETVSKNGGHLASNLGVVELTMALLRSFDLPSDKIVWDVGHQSYVHKILTGRKDAMQSIRQTGGISGFPSPDESPYDAFCTGHSSTSLSAAMGLAKARDFRQGTEQVIAVIGDGALSGGLAMEALNHIAADKTRMIIILNDNAMSISKNVGGISKYLGRIRTNTKYVESKRDLERGLRRIPSIGERILRKLTRWKDRIKYLFTPGVIFEEWGLTYLGPVDGHDESALEEVLMRAKKMDEPVIIHVATHKGHGYQYAEENPEKFHGISGFDIETGTAPKKAEDFSAHFGETLCRLAEEDKRVVAITPAMPSGSGLLSFSRLFPSRFFDVGIAEAHSVTFGAGLAEGGMIPVCAVYSSFLQRAYDSVMHDVAIGNKHVVFAVDRAGTVANDGKTHQGLYDMAFLSTVPNLAILSPASFSEQEKMLEYAVQKHPGAIAVRYPRGSEPAPLDCGEFVFGKAVCLREGTDVTIAAEGVTVHTAMKAADMLKSEGISCEILYLRTVRPLDMDSVRTSVRKTGHLVTLENGTESGGIGQTIAARLARDGEGCTVTVCAYPDEFLPNASMEDLTKMGGMTAEQIARKIKGVCR